MTPVMDAGADRPERLSIGSGYLNSAVAFSSGQCGLAAGSDLVTIAAGRLDVAAGGKFAEGQFRSLHTRSRKRSNLRSRRSGSTALVE